MFRNVPWLLLCSATLATTLPACTFITLSGGDQCETTQDCVDRGPEFVGSTCSPDKICTRALACETSQECIQANGGLPYRCRPTDKICAPLLSQDCISVVPNDVVGNDNAIFFGFLGPLLPGPEEGQDFSSIGIPIKQGVELALQEIKTNKTGLPGVNGGPPRPLGLVACHDLGDPIRAATHLTDIVKVPAIVGPAFSGITIDVVNNVTIPKGVLTMSASATSPAITDLDDNNLAWRTVPSDALQAIPLAELVGYVEARVRAEQGLTGADRIRIAMTVKGDAYGTGLANALTPLMVFNGKSAVDNGADFLSKEYPDPSAGEMVDFAAIAAEIVAFNPHVIMPMGTNEGITGVLGGVETAWPTVSPPPRPYYIFPDGGRLDELLTAVGKDKQLRARIVGTKPGRQGEAYNSFKIKYQGKFDAIPGTYAENAYDAGYLLSYAVLASGTSLAFGADVAAGLGKTVNGTAVDAGPDDISTAFQALSGGSAIDYVGASGPLNFNLKTGEAPADVETWCVALDQNGTPTYVSGVQYYDATANQVTGTFQPCCKDPDDECSENNECCSGTCATGTCL